MRQLSCAAARLDAPSCSRHRPPCRPPLRRSLWHGLRASRPCLATPTRARPAQSWSDQFRKEQDRRPTMADVRNTRIPWLAQRFQDYRNLQRKLLQSTPKLRGALAVEGRVQPGAGGGPAEGSGGGRGTLLAAEAGGSSGAGGAEVTANGGRRDRQLGADASETPAAARKAAAAVSAAAKAIMTTQGAGSARQQPPASAAAGDGVGAGDGAAPVKRGRGRPRKNPVPAIEHDNSATTAA